MLHRKPIASLLLHALGGALLLLAVALWLLLVRIGRGEAGHEPPLVYLLAIVAFCCSSAGAALLFNGHRLFEDVPAAGHWTPGVKPATDLRDVEGDDRSDGV